MTNELLPALLVFAGLLIICLYGLIKSNAASERNRGSTHREDYPVSRDPSVRL